MEVAVLVGNGFDISLGLETDTGVFISDFVQKYKSREGTPEGELAKEIDNDGIKLWSDFERMLGEYAKKFDEASYRALLEQKSCLEDYLGKWLRERSQRITDDFIARHAEECLASLGSFQKQLPVQQKNRIIALENTHRSEHIIYNLICFNYTDVLYRMYKACDGTLGKRPNGYYRKLGSFVFPHGSLESTELIMGVDNTNQIKSPALSKNREVIDEFVKSKIEDSAFFQSRYVQAQAVISKASLILVFGMSYGVTDRRWWRAILDRLNSSQSCILVLFSFELVSGFHSVSPHARKVPIEATKQSFISGCGMDSLSQSVMDRIIVVPSDLIFTVDRSIQ